MELAAPPRGIVDDPFGPLPPPRGIGGGPPLLDTGRVALLVRRDMFLVRCRNGLVRLLLLIPRGQAKAVALLQEKRTKLTKEPRIDGSIGGTVNCRDSNDSCDVKDLFVRSYLSLRQVSRFVEDRRVRTGGINCVILNFRFLFVVRWFCSRHFRG